MAGDPFLGLMPGFVVIVAEIAGDDLVRPGRVLMAVQLYVDGEIAMLGQERVQWPIEAVLYSDWQRIEWAVSGHEIGELRHVALEMSEHVAVHSHLGRIAFKISFFGVCVEHCGEFTIQNDIMVKLAVGMGGPEMRKFGVQP